MAKKDKTFGSDLAGDKQPRSYNSNYETDRIGFINRDKEVSETISAPMVLNPMGRPLSPFMSWFNARPGSGTLTDRHFINWEKETGRESIPGIAVYHLEPVLSTPDSYGQRGMADIFINKWTQMRILDTMTRKFQPGDIQVMETAVMLINAHVANLRRILTIMASYNYHSQNDYYNPTDFVRALGFNMTEDYIKQNWVGWRNRFNQSILGKLNSVRWFKDLVPGEKRWAGLFSEIYKDVSEDTHYCQVSLIRPASFWKLTSVVDEDTQVVTWSFTKEGYVDAAGVQNTGAFSRYMGMVESMITSLFYDDSSMNILATINAIAERTNSDQISSANFGFELLPLEPEELKWTYDFKMLLALHNATIMRGLDIAAPTFNPATGLVSQVIKPTENSMSHLLGTCTKIVNMPRYGQNNCDFANATQWTVCAQAFSGPSIDYLTNGFPAYTFGTDVIVNLVLYNKIRANDEADSTLAAVGVNQAIYEVSPTITDLHTICLLSNFALAPTIYFYTNIGSGDDLRYAVTSTLSQKEVVYAAGGNVLSDIHRVFFDNFWGYPIYPLGGEGSPSFSAT